MGFHIKALETLNKGTIHHQEEVFSVKSLIKYLVLLALLLPLAHSHPRKNTTSYYDSCCQVHYPDTVMVMGNIQCASVSSVITST